MAHRRPHKPTLRRRAALACAAVLLAATARADDNLRTHLDALVKPLIETETVVGLSIGVLHDGRTETFAYGKTALDGNVVPDSKTLFEIGSVSKVFTGLLLADAVERGTARLDDPLQKHLPAEVHVPTFDGRAIRLVDLATHTSGLPRLPTNMLAVMVKNPSNPYADYTVDMLYQFLNEHQLTSSPGAQYAYSNLGAGLLGHALAHDASRTYEELLRQRITTPLKLADTRIALDDAQRRRLAQPHNADAAKDANWDIPALAGAGAIRSTVDDLLLFLRANLAPDKTGLAAAIKLSHQPQFEIAKGRESIALGWHIRTEPQIWWHNGQTGGYHSFVGFQPGRRTAVVVLANTATGAVDGVGFRVLRLLAGEPVEPIEVRKWVQVDAAVLDRYVGRYAGVPGLDFHVSREAGRLFVRLTGQSRLRVFATSPTECFYRAVDAQITFDVNKDGVCNKLVLHQHGVDLPAWRGGIVGQIGRGLGKPAKTEK